MAEIFFLGCLTPPAADRIIYDASEINAAIARKELRQIENDLLKPGVLQKKLFKKSIVHVRILKAEK